VTEGINSLKNLTEVILSNNRFVSLEALSDLPKLNNLVAAHCQLKILPIKLPKLGYLNLSNNNFDDLSDLADFASPSLLSMDFSNNKIDHIPPEINRFISLSSLYFSNNSLAYLPTNVFQLRNLRTADFRTNPIPFASATAIRTKFKSDLPYCIVLV
jgi:leucine-rich repeat protein SHOC2